MNAIRLLAMCAAFIYTAIASNTYLGPTSPSANDSQLVKVEVLIKDAPEAGGVRIASVVFDEKNIPLKPSDISGNRGGASFQLRPGKYQLVWTVNRDKIAWPRTVRHEEEVTISPRDVWLQILIEGEEASIR